MNNGIYLTLPGQRVFLFDKYRNAYRSSTERFCRECEQAVGNSGVLICIENCGGFTDFQREAIEYLLESPVFALTMDIGHSHAAGDCDEPFLLAHEDRLRHMHVHDALGAKNHLAVGTGEIDIRGRLDLARRHGCRCVLETKTVEGLRLSVENLKRSYMAVDGM